MYMCIHMNIYVYVSYIYAYIFMYIFVLESVYAMLAGEYVELFFIL
jgi:hypothetical protein